MNQDYIFEVRSLAYNQNYYLLGELLEKIAMMYWLGARGSIFDKSTGYGCWLGQSLLVVSCLGKEVMLWVFRPTSLISWCLTERISCLQVVCLVC